MLAEHLMPCSYVFTADGAKLDIVAFFYAAKAICLLSVAPRVVGRLAAEAVD
jgi:hypothetical protein